MFLVFLLAASKSLPSDLSPKVRTIIKDDLLRHSKSVDYVVFYELGHMLGFQYRIEGRLYPFSEVINYI